MADAFECDRCETVESGTPAMTVEVKRPTPFGAVTDREVQSRDYCDSCAIEVGAVMDGADPEGYTTDGGWDFRLGGDFTYVDGRDLQ